MRRLSRVASAVMLLLAGMLAHTSAGAVSVTDLGTFASPGHGAGQLSGPNGIASANDGTIYVADTYNARVQIFSPVGISLGSFGTQGSLPGQFLLPYGIDVNSAGEVFVSDLTRHDVQVFSATGTFLRSFGLGVFSQPFGLWVSDAGFVFVTDRPAQLVRKFTAAGVYVASFGSGLGNGSLVNPQAVEGDGKGTLYVSDGSGVERVEVFTESGTLIDSFADAIGNPTGAALAGGLMYLTDYGYQNVQVVGLATRTRVDILGDNEPYAFNVPFDAATVGDSLLYLLEAGGGRVHRFRLASTGGSPPVVHVVAPNGGETFPSGTPVSLTWEATGDPGGILVSVFLSHNGGATYSAVATGLPNSGELVWTAMSPGSTHCRFKVSAVDSDWNSGEDSSDGDFSVVAVPPSVHVLSPNGGEAFVVGDVIPITWTASDDIGVVSAEVQLSRDGGLSYSVLTSQTGSAGAYLWPSGGPPSSQCRIQVLVRDGGGEAAVDISDANFALTQAPPNPSLELSPAGSFGSGGTQNGFFAGPDGIAVSPDGFVWVADTYNSRVQKFTLQGQHLLTVGSAGTGPGQFSRPYGLDVDSSGTVYVGDFARAIVQSFDSSGNYLATFGSGVLEGPLGLCVTNGVLYVTDRPGRVVRRFTTAGVPLPDFGPDFGGHMLFEPQNIEADGRGRLYVSDGGGWVRILSTGGDWLGEFGPPWMGNPTGAAFLSGHFLLTEYNLNRLSDVDIPGQHQVNILGDDEPYSLNSPLDAAASGDSLLFVLDTGNNRILRLRARSGVNPEVTVLAPNGGEHFSIGRSVDLRWSTTLPQHVVSIDLQLSRNDGASYQTLAAGVANTGSHLWASTPPASDQCRLRVVAHNDLGGTTQDVSDSAWRLLPSTVPPYVITPAGAFGTPGHLDGQFSGPDGIATSDDGFVYVADTYNSRVQKFTRTGAFVATFGGPGQFQRPYGIDVDAHGDVYVSDFGSRWVQKFSAGGAFLNRIGASVTFAEPLGLWVSDTGILYVTDRGADVVRLFQTDTGEPLAVWGPSLGGVTLAAPQNIEGDGLGLFYVSDGTTAMRVRELDGDGHHIESFGAPWVGNPTGAALAGSRMFLTEYALNRFSIVDLVTNSQIGTWQNAGDPLSFNSPIDAATLGDSLLYVLDTGNGRVVIFHLPVLTPPQVTVLSPNGGEAFFLGELRPLQWDATGGGPVASVDVLLSRDGGRSYSLVGTRLPNTGTYPWRVSPPISSECLVRVIGRDAGGGVGSDVSNSAFAIAGGATPTMVIQFGAEPTQEGVAVRWLFADPALQAASWLERADEQAGAYSRLIVDRSEGASGAVALDRSVAAGRSYWYRVVTQSGTQQWSFGPLEAVAREWITEFALFSPQPNPSADRTTLRFALPRESNVRLSILDVQGRIVAVPIQERRPAGRFSLQLELREGGAHTAPGLYFVRLQVEGGPSLTRRLVVQR